MSEPTQSTQIQHIVEEVVQVMGFQYEEVVILEKSERMVVMIKTENAKPLIGVQGANLNALHTLVRQIVTKRLKYDSPFTLDVNSYREHQREALVRKAHMIAERARSFQSAIEMDPMPSYERFVVHDTLSDMKDIKTYSEGHGKDRHVVVCYYIEP